MRKLLLYSFLFLLVYICVSCKDHYQIVGVSDNTMFDGSRIFLKKKVDNQWVVVDSCEVLHGKFKMGGVLDSVFMTSLFVDESRRGYVAATAYAQSEPRGSDAQAGTRNFSRRDLFSQLPLYKRCHRYLW